jgi:hypothetical protein
VRWSQLVNGPEGSRRPPIGAAEPWKGCPELGFCRGAGDGNRTRTISLGTLWRCRSATCRFCDLEDLDDLPVSDRDYPQALPLSGTQRARLPLGSGLAVPLGVWPSS